MHARSARCRRADPARGEAVVAGAEVDPLAADERDLALEDVERLVLVVVDVQGRSAAARVVGPIWRDGRRSRAARLDGDAAGLPPDVGEALAGERYGL